jgi:hypothetical protein
MISRKETVNLSNMPVISEVSFDSSNAEVAELFTNNLAEGKAENAPVSSYISY